MSAKISRTLLVLACILIILLPSLGRKGRQTFAAIGPGFATGTETAEPDAEEQPESGEELPEATSGPMADGHGDEPPQEKKIEPATEPDMGNSGEDMADYKKLEALYNLEPNERVVRTFAELRDALSEDNGVTAVHLGNDITMQGGVNINNGKPHIIIDGVDPTNPGQVEPYTLTDFDSALFTDTIYVNSSAVSYIHVRDLKITGKNYYGPFSVLDAASMSKVKLIFERVDYNGPQLGYHRQGTLYIIGCTVRLHSGNGICSSQEFSEARELIFEGANTIATDTTSNTIFWHPLGGSFTIADDSSLTLTSPNTSGPYGVFYADGSLYKIDITIGRRSVFDATILNSVAPTGNATLSSISVREGGSFCLTTTGTANRTVLSVGGSITVEPEAAFKINSFGGNYPALDIRTGDIAVEKDAVFHITSSNTNTSLLNLYGSSFICNDPASILLYNPGNRNISATTSPGRIYINAEQINYWDKASEGGFENPPIYRWKKADGTNIWIEGNLAVSANGNLTGLSSNYATGDLPGTAPSSASFNMASARVLAFGRLGLVVNAPTAASAEITGITAPGASVRASFYQQDDYHVMPDAKAGEDGVFVVPVDISLQQLTDITVMSSHQYLSAIYTASVGDTGSLTFTVPGELHFYTAALAPKTQTVKRLHTNWNIVVSDARGHGNTWSIYARELQPLKPEDPSKPVLENSLVFVDDAGKVMPLGASGTLLIYRHTTASDSEMVNISWASGRGVLARIPTGAAYSNQPYVGVIEWSLIDAP